MPIVIRPRDQSKANYLELCPSSWDLRILIESLQVWLDSQPTHFAESVTGSWIADVGFAPRSEATGGGPILSLQLMKQCLCYNLEIYLSEYPPFTHSESPALQDLKASERMSLLKDLKNARDQENH